MQRQIQLYEATDSRESTIELDDKVYRRRLIDEILSIDVIYDHRCYWHSVMLHVSQNIIKPLLREPSST